MTAIVDKLNYGQLLEKCSNKYRADMEHVCCVLCVVKLCSGFL